MFPNQLMKFLFQSRGRTVLSHLISVAIYPGRFLTLLLPVIPALILALRTAIAIETVVLFTRVLGITLFNIASFLTIDIHP